MRVTIRDNRLYCFADQNGRQGAVDAAPEGLLVKACRRGWKSTIYVKCEDYSIRRVYEELGGSKVSGWLI